MNLEEIKERLTILLRDTFKQDIPVDENTTADDIDSWDSLNHVILIKKIENEFGIEFDLFDIIELKNVGDILHYIKKRLDATH